MKINAKRNVYTCISGNPKLMVQFCLDLLLLLLERKQVSWAADGQGG